jgi:ElaA protein
MIEWKCKSFRTLTVYELYNILRLRSEVFVVEQNCIYLDADNKDQQAYHLFGCGKENIVAYTRLLRPGIAFEEASIGRVVSSPRYRKTGTGRTLMLNAIQQCTMIFGKQNIRIGAQLYLKEFYKSLGFAQTSAIYLEDNIEHIQMLYIHNE